MRGKMSNLGGNLDKKCLKKFNEKKFGRVAIAWNFACSISICFFKNIMLEFCIIWFSPYFWTLLKVEKWRSLPCFANLSKFRRPYHAKKSKLRKLPDNISRKSRVSIPKTRVLAQILRPLNFFPKCKLKISYFQNV